MTHRMRGDDPTRTLEQCRADALVDLMLTNVAVTTTVTVMIPVQTATVDEPPDSLQRDLLARGEPEQLSPSPLPNPLANTDDFGQPAADPNPLVEPTWQQICAKRCEPDHVTPFSHGGPTAIWNLVALCKHHHRVKHHADWTLTMTRDGDCTWTDPHGRQYATHPTNHHELAA
jgi:5-methylcytosine-specific restriction endonuclease McrA